MTEDEIEALLRDRIRFTSEECAGDKRVMKIIGYRQAARDVACLIAGEPLVLKPYPKRSGRPPKTAP